MTLAEDLGGNIDRILREAWDIQNGRTVPDSGNVALSGGGVNLDATVLYADLSQSSRLATELRKKTAAKVIKSFLYCMSRLITAHDGQIVSFDGDRVMGIFLGDTKNSNAAICALKMNYIVLKLLKPKLASHFQSLKDAGFEISHCVGIDTGSILGVRAGVRGANDLVWTGRVPNLAAKLSEIREPPFRTYITDDVFQRLNDDARYSGTKKELMWKPRSYTFVGRKTAVHRSSWNWKP